MAYAMKDFLMLDLSTPEGDGAADRKAKEDAEDAYYEELAALLQEHSAPFHPRLR